MAVFICSIILASESAYAAWRITWDGSDITGAAAPIDRGIAPVVNAVALGPMFGLRVDLKQDMLVVTDRSGEVWQAANGASTIDGGGRSLNLDSSVLISGSAAYVPLDALAEMSGFELIMDKKLQTASLSSEHQSNKITDNGLQTFTLAKTFNDDPERQDDGGSDAVETTAFIKELLPPAHDDIKLDIGMGYVQGNDCGTSISATGKINTLDVGFSGLYTMGPLGLRSTGTRFTLSDPEAGWCVEAGELFSEIWGSVRGMRYFWNVGGDRHPSIAVCRTGIISANTKMAVTYRDEIGFGKNVWLGGEMASDGSRVFRARYLNGPFNLYSCYQSSSYEPGRGVGVYASYNCARGIGLCASITHSGVGASKSTLRNMSVRFPLGLNMDLTLDRILSTMQTGQSATNAATLSAPLGPVRVLARYQKRDSRALGWGFNCGSREFSTSAIYRPDSRLDLDYRINNTWQQGGATQQWQQLVSSYRLSDKTKLQMFSAVPDLFDMNRLRLRLNTQLRDDMTVSVDYGMLSPYQSVARSNDKRGLMVMLHKQWNIATPSRGGEVKGQVIDQLGQPFGGVMVQMNDYRARCNKKGEYVFRKVPSGKYNVQLDCASVPANYKADLRTQIFEVKRSTRAKVNFMLTPLNTITGRVYCDKNSNEQCDSGEAVSGAVLMLGDTVTATDEQGVYTFYNVEPGQHMIKLDKEHLSENYSALSPTEINVDLAADKPVSGADFKVEKQERQIVFQNLQ